MATKGWSFGALVAALKDAAFYSRADIVNILHPVGTVLTFAGAQNPNTMFPGTVWAQQTNGRSIRVATSSTVGSTAGNIGSVDGVDSVVISAANIPAHTHTMAHTHTNPTHTHSINHDHGSFNTASAGTHTHPIPSQTDGGSVYGVHAGKTATSDTTISGGAHAHTIDIPSFAGTSGSGGNTVTGASSAGSTGSVGNGTSMSVKNASVYYAVWVRAS